MGEYVGGKVCRMHLIQLETQLKTYAYTRTAAAVKAANRLGGGPTEKPPDELKTMQMILGQDVYDDRKKKAGARCSERCMRARVCAFVSVCVCVCISTLPDTKRVRACARGCLSVFVCVCVFLHYLTSSCANTHTHTHTHTIHTSHFTHHSHTCTHMHTQHDPGEHRQVLE